jgi:pimeloyl-ACP methyl ester carboxylesterase
MILLKQLSLICSGSVLILYLGLFSLLRIYQAKLIFFPSPVVKTSPEDYHLSYREVWFKVANTKIHGWWIPAAQSSAPVLLYLHSNNTNNGTTLSLARGFHKVGLSTLFIDYRGYGKSGGGFPHEKTVYEDAEAAWHYLTVERQISPNRIFLYGHSLGGAIAIDLATRHRDLGGIIVEGTFTSMEDMANDIGLYHLFPTNLLLTQRFDSLAKIKFLRTPILFIHGTKDGIIPFWMSRKLFAAAPQPKKLLFIPEAGHNNVAKIGGDKYLRELKQFIFSVNN